MSNPSAVNAVRLDDVTYLYDKTDAGWTATEFGTGKSVNPISPELLAKIEADHEHQLSKRLPSPAGD